MQSALERTGTAIYVMDNNSNYVDREEIIGFDALYDSMMKSKKGLPGKVRLLIMCLTAWRKLTN